VAIPAEGVWPQEKASFGEPPHFYFLKCAPTIPKELGEFPEFQGDRHDPSIDSSVRLGDGLVVRRPEQFSRSLMRTEIPRQISRLAQQFSLIPVVQYSTAICRVTSSCCAFQTKSQLRSLLELAE
jgi:hypothetical protein